MARTMPRSAVPVPRPSVTQLPRFERPAPEPESADNYLNVIARLPRRQRIIRAGQHWIVQRSIPGVAGGRATVWRDRPSFTRRDDLIRHIGTDATPEVLRL